MSPAVVNDDRVLTTPQEGEQAKHVLSDLAGADRQLVVERHGERLSAIPPELGTILQQVLDVMSRGGTVTIGALPDVLTTVTAAEILGISRPTLMRMIRDGEIDSFKVGSHHRLKTTDVFAAQRARRARQRAAFDALRELDDSVD